MDAAEAVDRRAPSTASWKTLKNGFPTAPTPLIVNRYPIAAKISCVVVESAGVVGWFIDSALK